MQNLAAIWVGSSDGGKFLTGVFKALERQGVHIAEHWRVPCHKTTIPSWARVVIVNQEACPQPDKDRIRILCEREKVPMVFGSTQGLRTVEALRVARVIEDVVAEAPILNRHDFHRGVVRVDGTLTLVDQDSLFLTAYVDAQGRLADRGNRRALATDAWPDLRLDYDQKPPPAPMAPVIEEREEVMKNGYTVSDIIDDKSLGKVFARVFNKDSGRRFRQQPTFVGNKLFLSVTDAAESLGLHQSTLHSQVHKGQHETARLATAAELRQLYPQAQFETIADPAATGIGWQITISNGKVEIKQPGRNWTRPVALDGDIFFSLSEAAKFLEVGISTVTAAADTVKSINGLVVAWPDINSVRRRLPDAASAVSPRSVTTPTTEVIPQMVGDELSFAQLVSKLNIDGKHFLGLITGTGVSLYPVTPQGREVFSDVKTMASRDLVPSLIAGHVLWVRL